ncbi:hypothetical protein HK405_011227 [Cladochytrium tenue]|nr:hypothetical protein HK405_011227 [Cladochytrium tenue]
MDGEVNKGSDEDEDEDEDKDNSACARRLPRATYHRPYEGALTTAGQVKSPFVCRIFSPTHMASSSASTKLYVGRLPRGIGRRDLEDVFAKYGRIVSCEVKMGGFAFVEYEDRRDAEDALNALNGSSLDGERITVEWSKRSPGTSNSECPENKEQGMDVRSGRCFKCGGHGHLARECRGSAGRVRSRSRSPRRDRRSPSRDRRYPSDRRSPDRRRYDDYHPRSREDYDAAYRRRSPPPPPPPPPGGDYRRGGGEARRPSFDGRYPYETAPPPPPRGYVATGGPPPPPAGYDDYPPPPRDYYRGPPPPPSAVPGGRDAYRDSGRDGYPGPPDGPAGYGRDGAYGERQSPTHAGGYRDDVRERSYETRPGEGHR